MTCKHRWEVYSTALCPPTIMVRCLDCDATGSITDYTQEEWRAAYHAPSNPFVYIGEGTVEIRPKPPS